MDGTGLPRTTKWAPLGTPTHLPRRSWTRLRYRCRCWDGAAVDVAKGARDAPRKRGARKASLPGEIRDHGFRGTGIIEYLRNGGDLEVAARIAAHESTCSPSSPQCSCRHRCSPVCAASMSAGCRERVPYRLLDCHPVDPDCRRRGDPHSRTPSMDREGSGRHERTCPMAECAGAPGAPGTLVQHHVLALDNVIQVLSAGCWARDFDGP